VLSYVLSSLILIAIHFLPLESCAANGGVGRRGRERVSERERERERE
jgi:hypothetical protein